MASKKGVTLSQFMSKFAILAKDLSSLFNVTRQTIYNNREKQIGSLSKNNQSTLCQICSVKNIGDAKAFYSQKSNAEGRLIIKNNIKRLLKGESKIVAKDRKIIELNPNVSDEYIKLLERILNDRLKKGNDYALLNEIDKQKK